MRNALLNELKTFIRSGGYTLPGGYQCALLMADGECIDAQSARENYRLIRDAMRLPKGEWSRAGCTWGQDPQWTPVTIFVHYEWPSLTCAHSGREIPSAYGDPEEQ